MLMELITSQTLNSPLFAHRPPTKLLSIRQLCQFLFELNFSQFAQPWTEHNCRITHMDFILTEIDTWRFAVDSVCFVCNLVRKNSALVS